MKYRQLSDCLSPTHMDFGLQRMQALMTAMGNPNQQLQAIHIAGTNGKGSVAAYFTSILLVGWYSVGTTTSPHLVTERERIALNGQPMDEETFQKLCGDWFSLFQQTGVTYFEAMTALAFKAFQQASVDWAVIEVGLGGRLDATNVLESPAVTVITSIGLDHTEFLGDSLAAIATEKAGIGKAGTPMVVGPSVQDEALEAIHAVAQSVGFPVIQASRDLALPFKNPLLGRHQQDNLATALAVVDVLSQQGRLALSPQTIVQGVATTRWPARLEVFENQRIILDGSHNADGFGALVEALENHPAKTGVWLVSLKNTKAIEPLIQAILACQPQQVIVTEGPNDHGGYHSPETLGKALRDEGYERNITIESDSVKALTQLQGTLKKEGVALLITGSLHTAGVLRPLLTHA